MNRQDFKKSFGGSGPLVLPVVHVLDAEQAQRNIQTAIDGGCPGDFLINHDFEKEQLIPIITEMRQACLTDVMRTYPDVEIEIPEHADIPLVVHPYGCEYRERMTTALKLAGKS